MAESGFERAREEQFPALTGKVWLNAAHQGPMPRVALSAAHEAVDLKANPASITDDLFSRVPEQGREALARLLGARTEDVILANSASYGLHLLAHAFRWRSGDQVLAVEADFPSTGLPWLLLERKGVEVRYVRSRGRCVTAKEIEAALTSRTKIVAVTWVHSLNGGRVDLHAVGAVCRARGVRLVVNGSQGVGGLELNVEETPIDALTSVGFKFLCGPYGTGFLWLRRGVWPELAPTKAYWLTLMKTEDLQGRVEMPSLPNAFRTRDHHIFAPANFNNVLPWTRCLNYLNELGMADIEARNRELGERLVTQADSDRYEVTSTSGLRSNLIFLKPKRGQASHIVKRLREMGIYVSERCGEIRVSPHFYNTTEDIQRFAEQANRLG